jgi:hypothetical protein
MFNLQHTSKISGKLLIEVKIKVTESKNRSYKVNVSLKEKKPPTWTYGVELWGSAKPANISNESRIFQSKVLRTIHNAPWYVFKFTTLNDLNIPTASKPNSEYPKAHSPPTLIL